MSSTKLTGRVGNLTDEQKTGLDQFRKELKADGLFIEKVHDDAWLLRFLRARRFDLAKAKIMFADNEAWRKEFSGVGVDKLYETFEYPEKEQVDQYYPQYYHKTDKDGRPVYIEQLGRLDIKALYSVTTPERQLQRLVVEYERFQRDRLPACSKVQGTLVETSCTIMDLKNVGISTFYKVKDYVRQASDVGQNHYPETMGKFYIINAPYIFSTAWAIIKGWLDPATVEKISILGSNYHKDLLAQIPAENLPEELGGTCKCPGGCSLSDAGVWNETSKNGEAAPK